MSLLIIDSDSSTALYNMQVTCISVFLSSSIFAPPSPTPDSLQDQIWSKMVLCYCPAYWFLIK